MKVKVIKSFRDKETGSILRPGIVIDITEERVEELISTLDPFIEVVEAEPSDGKTIDVEEGKLILPDFNTMKKEDIINFAKDVMEIELDPTITKAEMIKLLQK